MFLLIRCALFLVFAFNISGDNSINLLVISSTIAAIFIAFALSGMVYKNWYLNALELSFILNLVILTVATYVYHVTHSGGNQAAVTYTSTGIAFLTFVGIVINHIFVRIKSKMQCTQRCYQLMYRNANSHSGNGANLEHQCEVTPNIPSNVTHTEVSLCELRSPLDLLDTK